MAFDQISLKGRALRLLAGREHSRAELQRKLSVHETEPGELAKALDELEAKGFINEQRVLESVLHRRSARLGASRVRQELQAKGLDPQAVAEAVAGLQGSEEARAREVWRKRFAGPPADAAERGKQMRFLLTRGFGAEVVRRVVKGAPADDSED
ncbi:MAG: recombination regulator RecX [Hydrogenophaga sp.]|jgi:regulatory protein|uniref:recombination regulator RecX n=1 Tax=unclassified Hydrogenophaga TaxID=2610897 RepID=UPI0036D3AF84